MIYNVLLVGLGNIGLGKGTYSHKWNNHFYSLKNSDWVKNLYISDPYVNCKKLCGGKVSLFKEDSFDKSENRLLVDAGPFKKRIERINFYNNLFKPNKILLEKPVDYSSDRSLNGLKHKIKINYFRRTLFSSKILREEVKNKITKITFIYNNGLFNAGSHFFDFIDFLGVNLNQLLSHKISVNNNAIYFSNIIKIINSEEKRHRFDISFLTNEKQIKYLNFGKIIKFDNQKPLKFNELSKRFKNIYCNKLDISQLTDVDTDKLIFKIINKINRVKNETY